MRFERRDLRDVGGSWDVIFSSAALQWLPDHPALLARLAGWLRPGGRLAVQVPNNFDHPSHVVADRVGRQFGLVPLDRSIGVMAAVDYSRVLWELGLVDQRVEERIYAQELDAHRHGPRLGLRLAAQLVQGAPRPTATASSTTGTGPSCSPSSATRPASQPYFYPYPRILFTARRPA